MRLFLSRTVAKRFTRFTVFFSAGVWSGSCEITGNARLAAIAAVRGSFNKLFREAMYTFLDGRQPLRVPGRGARQLLKSGALATREGDFRIHRIQGSGSMDASGSTGTVV